MTKIISSVKEWQDLRQRIPSKQRLGLVPTMGNLHPGHLSLMAKSRQDNDLTVVSIFVNPTQFNQACDFEHYPRTLDEDISLLQQAQVDYCFLPSHEEIYPDHYRYRMDEYDFSKMLEGEHRPGHYAGVLTIVMKLFHITQAHHAYFGEKDFQQYQLIHDMAQAFFMPIQVHVCPTIREASGLAYSSRNRRLSVEEKKQAEHFAQIFHQPQWSLDKIKNQLEKAKIQVEYLTSNQQRRYAAVHIGPVRLIDNYAMESHEE